MSYDWLKNVLSSIIKKKLIKIEKLIMHNIDYKCIKKCQNIWKLYHVWK